MYYVGTHTINNKSRTKIAFISENTDCMGAKALKSPH